MMKKSILILSFVLLFGISAYTVKSYNKNNNVITKISNQSNESSPVQLPTNNNVKEKLAASVKIKATGFKLQDLNGKEVSLSDFKGKNVFLNFWATWCPSCKAEMPEIEKLYQETKNSDLVILAINLGENRQTVQSFKDKNKYNFDMLLDTDQEVAIKYDITSIPTSFFIDKNGTIVSKKIGAMNIDEMKSYVNSLNH
jgi:thiol-disulfide isomerase/thioredoxin